MKGDRPEIVSRGRDGNGRTKAGQPFRLRNSSAASLLQRNLPAPGGVVPSSLVSRNGPVEANFGGRLSVEARQVRLAWNCHPSEWLLARGGLSCAGKPERCSQSLALTACPARGGLLSSTWVLGSKKAPGRCPGLVRSRGVSSRIAKRGQPARCRGRQPVVPVRRGGVFPVGLPPRPACPASSAFTIRPLTHFH
jgi:hypothetical protein